MILHTAVVIRDVCLGNMLIPLTEIGGLETDSECGASFTCYDAIRILGSCVTPWACEWGIICSISWQGWHESQHEGRQSNNHPTLEF